MKIPRDKLFFQSTGFEIFGDLQGFSGILGNFRDFKGFFEILLGFYGRFFLKSVRDF